MNPPNIIAPVRNCLWLITEKHAEHERDEESEHEQEQEMTVISAKGDVAMSRMTRKFKRPDTIRKQFAL
jgi:hypothetical protein